MAEGPRFAELPTPPPASAGWDPSDGVGRVRLGLSPRQQGSWLVLTAGLVLVVAGGGLVSGRWSFLVVAPLFAALMVGVTWRAGVDLGPATLTIRGGARRTRTVRWTAVADISAGDGTDGEVVVRLAGERPLTLRAPRRRWIVTDEHFEAKVDYLRTWWLERRAVMIAADALAVPADPDDPARQVQGFLAAAAQTTRPVEPAGGPGTDADQDGPPGTGAAAPRPDGAPTIGFGPDSRFSVPTLVGLLLIATTVGYLFLGRDVVVLAIALFVLLRFARDPGRPLALAAFLLLCIAAVATVVQDFPPQLSLAYASRRSIAAEAGAIVGLFMVLAVLIFSVTERTPTAAPRRRLWRGIDRADVDALFEVVPSWVSAAWPFAAVGLVALVVRGIGLPAALPEAYGPLLDNLRQGTGYSLTLPSGAVPVGDLPPLSASIVAYNPLGPKATLLGVSMGTVALVAWYAHRRWGRPASIMAMATAALLPSLWSLQLPDQLAGLLVLGGIVLADPERGSPRRAALAGACLGLAFLARPEAGVALVVVIGWLVVQWRRSRPGQLGLVAAVAVLVMAPWLNFVWSEFGRTWPMSTLAATLNDPTTRGRLPAILAFSIGLVVLALLATAMWDRRREALRLLPVFVLPWVCVGLALTDLPTRDLLSWGAPLAALIAGPWLADLVREYLGPVLVTDSVPTWEHELAAARERAGVRALARRPDDQAIDLEPDEDHLFL